MTSAGRRRALTIGALTVDPPVVLAPMAGVTNRAFRSLCRRYGGALLVSEMVNARGIVEGSRRSVEMTAFDQDETTRSIQLYGTDPHFMGEATRIVIDRGANHVDLNFGCPVRKVTRHGGGAAIPARPRLLAAIVEAAVRAAHDVPVTVKMRMGVDEERLTFLAAGRAAATAGAAWIALHARTAEQYYSGHARWDAIAELVAYLPHTPVLGNGDIWSAADALQMQAHTGCAGVVVGRACLGRPWFFGDLHAAFHGEPLPAAPTLREVAGVIHDHVRLLAEHQSEFHAALAIRKHVGWYLTGYPVGGAVRRRLVESETVDELCARLDELDDMTLPASERDRPRGTRRGPYPISLPDGWMTAHTADPPRSPLADLAISGG